jgi:hypothetical protein
MADVTRLAVADMNKRLTDQRLSFELPDESVALRLAQQIANACGRIVSVSDDVDADIGQAAPQYAVVQSQADKIRLLRKLADGMAIRTKQ